MTSGARLVIGIFVGGRGSRMGGVAKGLLKAPSSETTLVERLRAELARALPDAELVLVGAAEAYAGLGVGAIGDEPVGVGPLGGLIGLLAHAEQRGATYALVLACDLPRVAAPLLQRLGTEAPSASVLITTQGDVKNPLLARYTVAEALPAARATLEAGKRSLQAVLERLTNGAVVMALSPAEAASVEDWDNPEDMQKS